MGSHQDLRNATAFIAQHRIVPIVSHVLDGLESAEEGFELIKRGEQFGKVVIKLRHPDANKAKL
jgi:NADPH-dependent curcumin reductase CurA